MAIAAVDEVMLREPRLLVPRMQPLGPVKIDRTHPIGKRVVVCALATPSGPVDLASGRPFVKVGGTPTMTPASRGVLANTNGANYSWELPLLNTAFDKSEVMLFWYGEQLGAPTIAGGIFVITHSSNSGTDPYIFASLKHQDTSGTSISYAYNSNGTYLANSRTVASMLNKPSSLALHLSRKASSAFGYANGTIQGAAINTYSANATFGTGARIVIGEDFGSSRNGASGMYLGVLLSDEVAGAVTALALHTDPYQFLIPA
jgi:hypothetical protein